MLVYGTLLVHLLLVAKVMRVRVAAFSLCSKHQVELNFLEDSKIQFNLRQVQLLFQNLNHAGQQQIETG